MQKNRSLLAELICVYLLIATHSTLYAARAAEENVADAAAAGAAASAAAVMMAAAPQQIQIQQTQNGNMAAAALPDSVLETAAAAGAVVPAAAAAISGQTQQNVLTTTPATPRTTNHLPDYLKNCFYADQELCLHWYEMYENGTLSSTSLNAAANSGDAANTSAGAAAAAANGELESTSNNNNNNNANRDTNSCQCRPHPSRTNSWYCCNITEISMISSCGSSIRNWTNLHIYNMTMPKLNLTNSIYRSLQSIAITDGNILSVVNSFPRYSSIKCLNISNNNITDISPRAVKYAPHLEFLDISKNNLSRVPNWNQNANMTMDISGNKRMICEPLNEAIYSDSFKFVNPEKSFCLYNASHSWFNSTDYVSIKQLERTKQCRTKCPVIPGHGNCTCFPDQIIIIQGDQSKPICHVDCSNMELKEFPSKLPDNTFTLNITNNKITSLGNHFGANPTYFNIVKLIADNNQISSMNEFEGTKFIEHFQRIYMRNNSLIKIPEYFLNNALMDTEIGRRIYLAGNKLQCDCNSAKTLQNWLKERSSDIPDYMEIKCRNLPQSVIELQETKLCQAPSDWTDYIYYLIAGEVLLLLAIITKVSYDYWVFKTAGYLPWPASKMPKLPCDWLCES